LDEHRCILFFLSCLGRLRQRGWRRFLQLRLRPSSLLATPHTSFAKSLVAPEDFLVRLCIHSIYPSKSPVLRLWKQTDFPFTRSLRSKTSTSHSTFYWSLFITFSLDGVVVSLLRYLSRRVEVSQTILFPGDEGFRMHIVALCVFMAGEELGVAG